MIKICEICENKFDTNSFSRIYCYNCSGDSISDIPLLKVAKRSFINNTKERFMKESNALYYDFYDIENAKKIEENMMFV